VKTPMDRDPISAQALIEVIKQADHDFRVADKDSTRFRNGYDVEALLQSVIRDFGKREPVLTREICQTWIPAAHLDLYEPYYNSDWKDPLGLPRRYLAAIGRENLNSSENVFYAHTIEGGRVQYSRYSRKPSLLSGPEWHCTRNARIAPSLTAFHENLADVRCEGPILAVLDRKPYDLELMRDIIPLGDDRARRFFNSASYRASIRWGVPVPKEQQAQSIGLGF